MQRAARRLALASFRSSYIPCSSSSINALCLADSSSTSILMSRLPALMRAPGACRLHACSAWGHEHARWLARPAVGGRAAFSSSPGADRSSHKGHARNEQSSSRGGSSEAFSNCSTSGRHPRVVCGAQGHTHDNHSGSHAEQHAHHDHDHHHDHHDHHHDHHQVSNHSSSSHHPAAGSNGHIHGASSAHHHDHHHHPHHHHHHHHHHFHTDSTSGGPQNPLLVALDRIGLFRLADHLEHHTPYTIAAVASFAASLALHQAGAAGWLAASLAAPLSTAALAVPFLLLGVPQLAETLVAFAGRQVDTHVLMSLSIVGTLYMGMAHEAALLLLLFRVSHLLEDKLTAAASGSLERLFDAVPSTATLVEVEEGGGPRTATARQVAATSVALGSHVLVRPGEQVPLDGSVVWGTSNVSLQHISGESLPVKVVPGAEVPAGSLSMDGLLVLRVTASSEDSTPARMARMAAQAQAERPQLTRRLDQIGGVWSKAVIGATAATMVLLPFFGVPFLGDRGALYRAMGVLTAGSPCALALVPLAYACAIAVITMRGMLVKSGAALDALHACKVVALDKTGTLTTGALTLSDGFVVDLGAHSSSSSSSQSAATMAELIRINPMPAASSLLGRGNSSWGGQQLQQAGSPGDDEAFHANAVKYAVALSRLSNHPVSRALVDAGPTADTDVSVLSFEQVAGSGVQGVCQIGSEPAVTVRFGALDWVASFLPEAALVTDALHMRTGDQQDKPSRAVAFISVSDVADTYGSSAGSSPEQQQQQQPGQLGSGSSQLSMLCFEDVIQAGVPAAVQQLQSGGWCSSWLQPAASSKKSVVMLTGDNPRIAAAVAAAVGIQDYKASLQPQDKLQYVKDAATAAAGGQEKGGLVMAGDGINDAPALAASSVGVAIATSPTDMVASAADIIILNGQGVTNLPWLFHVAERTDTILRQNLALALLSVVVTTLPTLAGLFPLWLAVTLHEGSTLLVALNSLRLLLESRSTSGPPTSSTKPAAGASSNGQGRGGSGGAASGAGSGSSGGAAAGDAAPVFAMQGSESSAGGAVPVGAAVAAAAV